MIIDLDARRVERLTSRDGREALAGAIDRLLVAADGPASRRRILPHRAALRANASQLRGLADELRKASSVDPDAAAALERLLTDGTGPVFAGDGDALARTIAPIRVRLVHQSTTRSGSLRPPRAA